MGLFQLQPPNKKHNSNKTITEQQLYSYYFYLTFMYHPHCFRQPFQLLLIGSILLLGQSVSLVQASAANSGTTAAHHTAHVEIDANGQVSSSTGTSATSESSGSLDSQHPNTHSSPGVDCSWPTHHHDSEYFPEYRKEAYLHFVRGCNQQIQSSAVVGHNTNNNYYNNRVNQRERLTCYKYEQDRMDMNLNQPKMMGKSCNVIKANMVCKKS